MFVQNMTFLVFMQTRNWLFDISIDTFVNRFKNLFEIKSYAISFNDFSVVVELKLLFNAWNLSNIWNQVATLCKSCTKIFKITFAVWLILSFALFVWKWYDVKYKNSTFTFSNIVFHKSNKSLQFRFVIIILEYFQSIVSNRFNKSKIQSFALYVLFSISR